MDEKRIMAFSRMEKKVIEKLRKASYGPVKHKTIICQLLVLPSFWNPFCWSMYWSYKEKQRKHEEWINLTKWDSKTDYQTLEKLDQTKEQVHLKPTIYSESLRSSREEIDGLITQFTGSIPFTIEQNWGVADGVSYELIINRLNISTHIRWNSQLPQEWDSIRTPLVKLATFFEDSWTKKSQNEGKQYVKNQYGFFTKTKPRKGYQ